MSGECQVNVKSLSELDIGGRETCMFFGGLIYIFLGVRSKANWLASKTFALVFS